MDNLLFQLKKKLEYSHGGEYEKTATIELGPPSHDCFKEATKLSQFVMAAVLASTRFQHLGQKDQVTKPEDVDLDSEAIKFILMSSEDDFSDIYDCFCKLACKVGTVAEGESLKHSHFAKMEYEDNIKIVCEYIANFIVPSLF